MSSFYYIIPAEVMHDPDLNHGEKLLYGLLSGLAKKSGYCHAGNDFLESTLCLSQRAIQSILEKLENKNYISRKYVRPDNNPFKTIRLIYINHNFKKSLPDAENCTLDHEVSEFSQGDAENSTPGMLKTAPILSKGIISKEKTVCPDPSPPEGGVGRPASKIRKLNSLNEEKEIVLDHIFQKAIQEKKDWGIHEIHEAWALLEKAKLVNDPFGFIEGTIKKIRNKKKFNKMEKAAQKEKSTCLDTPQIEIAKPPRPVYPLSDPVLLRQLFPI